VIELQAGILSVTPDSAILFTAKELIKLYSALSHTAADKLLDLLKIARPTKVTKTRETLQGISKLCRIARDMALPAPHSFGLPKKIVT
jgi:hypothetical protein